MLTNARTDLITRMMQISENFLHKHFIITKEGTNTQKILHHYFVYLFITMYLSL